MSSSSLHEIRKNYRVFDFSVFDLVLTFIVILIIALSMGALEHKKLFLFTTYFMITSGILIHRGLGTNTKLGWWLGLNDLPDASNMAQEADVDSSVT